MWRTGRLVRASMVFWGVAAGVTWSYGAAAQQHSRPSWNELSPEQQGRARENYERFRGLPESDQQNVQQLYRRWQGLAPTQRQQLRQNYERYMSLDPAQRQQFDRGYSRWKSHQRHGGRTGAEP